MKQILDISLSEEKWKAAMVECRLCHNIHAAVYPYSNLHEDNLECPNCHNMTCEPIDNQ